MSTLLDNNLLRLLERGADIIVAEQKRTVPTIKIAPYINRGTAKRLGEYSASVRIWVDLEKAPMARAFEKGSGIHGSRKQTYPIRPKNKTALAFFWEKLQSESDVDSSMGGAGKLKGFGGGGKVIMNFVDHPGVAAQPYMSPAFESKKQEVTTLLRGGVRDNIKKQIRLIWEEVMND